MARNMLQLQNATCHLPFDTPTPNASTASSTNGTKAEVSQKEKKEARYGDGEVMAYDHGQFSCRYPV
jgi:hypothetical protein